MTSFEERQRRVANGSRRKRDLEAVARPDFDAFTTQLPDELPHRVRAAAMRLYCAKRHKMPTADEVFSDMKARGLTKAQIEAKYGVGTQ